jgi:hypothetical protein
MIRNLMGQSFFRGKDGRREKLAGAQIFRELLSEVAVSSHTMTIKQSLTVLVAAAGLSALAGCMMPPSAAAPQESTKFSVENTDKFVPLDSASQSWVTCTGLQEWKLGDGRMIADVKNRIKAPVAVQVQCVFEDNQGFATDAMVPWRILNLPVDSTEAVRFVALDARSTKYSIHVRELR